MQCLDLGPSTCVIKPLHQAPTGKHLAARQMKIEDENGYYECDGHHLYPRDKPGGGLSRPSAIAILPNPGVRMMRRIASLRGLRASSFLIPRRPPTGPSSLSRLILCPQELISSVLEHSPPHQTLSTLWNFRSLSYGAVNLVLSQGKPKFEVQEVDPPKKDKWKNKKRFKMQKRREKEKRKAANRNDPRRLGITRKKKQKFANAEERINYKLEKARIKEALLLEKLKRYEVPKVQGPTMKPDPLSGEERFYLKKISQKKSNYVPIGRRGVYGGVILNMHMHWKKHETVKVICKPCKPGQVKEFAQEIARLSGGIPIHFIGDDTIVFYRGKNYAQPEVMSPIDTLSRKKALEKSKYEQSLESVQRFIAIAEKELELYYRHVALYGDPNSRDPIKILDVPGSMESRNMTDGRGDISFTCLSESDDSDRVILDIERDDDHGKFRDRLFR
ncbi:hypothetical protein SAY86_004028 [Trapa natans]|uniref:CRM domain-containing protein n=1 Tax=Trapa natans TaxID=22666 RepID=A0AAN7RND4_TRANT|nr:hypothetical protein SAY86_004028 [Trapa natans]